MKIRKFVLYCLVVMYLLFVGVFVNQLETNSEQTRLSSHVQTSDTECSTKQYFTVTTINFQSLAEILVQVQLAPVNTVILQYPKLNFYRLVRFNQDAHSVFLSNFLDFKSVRELLQLKGFYLYHLRKLLI